MPVKEESKVQLGQKLLIFLKNDQVVHGEVVLLKSSHLRLKEVRDYSTNKIISRSAIYYVNEIEKIRIIPKTSKTELINECQVESRHETSNSINSSSSGSSFARSESVKSTQVKSPRYYVELPQGKLDSMINNINTFVYISAFNKKYWDAIKDLRLQRVIAVNVENVKYGRKSEGSIISMATERKIYLFDIMHLRQPPRELKEILESREIMKVFHYAERQLDYLMHKFGVHVRNFFDTMVAYMLVSNTKEIVSIEFLIQTMFQLPIIADDSIPWTKRPLKQTTMIRAAANVAFLIEIQEYLVHKHMLKNFYEVSRKVMFEMCNQNDIPFICKPLNQLDVKEVDFKNVKSSLEFDSSFTSNTSQ